MTAFHAPREPLPASDVRVPGGSLLADNLDSSRLTMISHPGPPAPIAPSNSSPSFESVGHEAPGGRTVANTGSSSTPAAPDSSPGKPQANGGAIKRRLILADDHPIFLEGLKRLLLTEFDVVGTAASGSALVELVKHKEPDLIVTDYSMPDLTGVEAVKVLKDSGAKCKIVMLTMHEDVEYALEALELGVDGYVLKRAASSELISAITGALEGERWISPALAVDIISATAGLSGNMRAHKKPTPKPAIEAISARQRHILQGLVQGKIAKEIAAELGLSRKTVEYHKYKMMDDLGVKSTAELIQMAVRSGVAN